MGIFHVFLEETFLLLLIMSKEMYIEVHEERRYYLELWERFPILVVVTSCRKYSIFQSNLNFQSGSIKNFFHRNMLFPIPTNSISISITERKNLFDSACCTLTFTISKTPRAFAFANRLGYNFTPKKFINFSNDRLPKKRKNQKPFILKLQQQAAHFCILPKKLDGNHTNT